jgi:hypothetical protein
MHCSHELDHETQKQKVSIVSFLMAIALKSPPLDKPSTAEQTLSSTTGPPQRSLDGISRMMNPMIVTEDEASQWDQSSVLVNFGEDYGLVGI